MRYKLGLVVLVSALLAACGGGGGGGGSVTPPVSATTAPPTAAPTATPTPAPTATPSPTAAPAAVVAAGAAPTTAPLGSVAGQSGSLSLPAAASGSGSVTAQLQPTQPATTPTLQSSARLPRAIGTSALTPILFIAFTPSATLTFAATPSFSFTFPAGFALATGAQAYVALYDPTQSTLGWQTFLGPGAVSGSTTTGISLAFASVARSVTFQAGQTYVFCLFATAATITLPTPTPAPTATPTPTPTPSPTPTATPTASPTPTAAPTSTAVPNANSTPIPTSVVGAQTGFACPTADVTSATARGTIAAGTDAVRRAVRHRGAASSSSLLAVAYDRTAAQSAQRAIAARETQLGTTLVQTYDFPHTGVAMHVLAVPAGQIAGIASYLRAQPGVRSVAQTGGSRYASTVTPYFPNDPYFDGFTAAQNSAAQSLNVSTYKVAPYEELATVPGQWDMHAIGLEYAFGYSQPSNGSNVVNALALGSSSVKIAIIDTGEDTGHPELSGKIVAQGCFITGTNNVQSTSPYTTDPDGHGTDVAGIAAANLGNGVGFVGAGGNVSLVAYRVFPTPDNTCAGNNPDARCSATTQDIASAINDAVSHQHVNVISMSLGGGNCSSAGVDNDPVEGAAVANAIAAGVVVVTAAGNESAGQIDAPGCDSGVIAVGASALADGQPNGTNANASGEYVASYSNHGSPGATVRSSSAWGIVAPGGDPSSDNDTDDLHWIENIWTSTPYNAGDAGQCTNDYPNGTLLTSPDCRTLIAGTSMATPHVAGAAALILSVTGGSSSPYQSPSAMKQLLCATAHDIGDPNEGCGRLNVYAAMAQVLGDAHPPSP